MKPLEYIHKYKLDETDKFSHNLFVDDLTSDFLVLLELTKNKDGQVNIKGFEQTVRAVRDKWDAIQRKTANKLPDKLWNYFFASFLAPMRENYFPTEMEKRRKEQEAEKRRREDKRAFYEEMHNGRGFGWGGSFEDMINDLLKNVFRLSSTPNTEFSLLNLESTCTEEDIMSSFRKLSLQHHPDKGGNKEFFISIVEAKNKCLAYIKNKTI